RRSDRAGAQAWWRGDPYCRTHRCGRIPRRGRAGSMTGRFVLAIDQGTTSSRCLVFDRHARLAGMAQRAHRQHYPRSGWVEQDALEIWRTVEKVVPAALRDAGIEAGDVAAIGIANQRETTVVWDRATGVPVRRAIVWQDVRTEALVERLREM